MHYLVEVSIKAHDTADFVQRLPRARMAEKDLLYMFAAYGLQRHTYLRIDCAPTFYSREGVYPMARLLIVDEQGVNPGQSKVDKLLATLDSRSLPMAQRAHHQATA